MMRLLLVVVLIAAFFLLAARVDLGAPRLIPSQPMLLAPLSVSARIV